MMPAAPIEKVKFVQDTPFARIYAVPAELFNSTPRPFGGRCREGRYDEGPVSMDF